MPCMRISYAMHGVVRSIEVGYSLINFEHFESYVLSFLPSSVVRYKILFAWYVWGI
jgi:hypothetical protein